MYGCVHGYFMFYHVLTSACIRRVRTSAFYSRSAGPLLRSLVDIVVVVALAYVTAWMETKTIEAFPYYSFENREAAQSIGSVVYGIYFIVSFPMFVRIDEWAEAGTWGSGGYGDNHGPTWTWQRAAIDSLGSALMVTILLDIWRIVVGNVFSDGGAGSILPKEGLTWFG
jgi:cycloeucalenol cycloisomerase